MTPTPIRTIVVGVDGSPDASAAMDFAVDLTGQLAAELVVVHAVGLTEPDAAGRTVPAQSIIGEVAQRLDEVWAEPAIEAGVVFRTVMENGPPTLAIARVASREDADMVIIGHRGMGKSASVLGSTAHFLVETSEVPTCCIRSDAPASSGTSATSGNSAKAAKADLAARTEMSIP